ncbi:MAG: ABC transporter substrate-binding protein [Oscillibacter sp.]|jgi:peptide/nickel transport system substrate-binding protein|nr:ABC transporter substrate-binding protein [Oscillibacter sp.]
MKKRILAFLLLIALLSTVLSGCGDGSSQAGSEATQTGGSTGESVQGGEITVGIAQDLDDSLDPHKAVKAGTREILFNVFEGLVKPTPNGDLEPAVAESYVISDDERTYTFTLREGVQFHNGETVTADDVVYSIERCADASEGEPLVAAFSVIQSVEATDDHTVVITLSEPDSDFLSYLTTAILPRDYADEDTAPVGTGPFKFVSRTAQDAIVLEKFDGYWGTPAYLDKVTFKIIENADALVLSLQSGAIDLCPHLTATQVSQLSGDTYQILEGTMNLVQAMYLNNAVEPLNNEKVRQALSYAVDKQTVMDMIADGHGKAVGSSMYPTFTKYFDDSLTDYYTQNIDKAKALLAEAGYPDGFALEITVPSNYQPHVDTAQVLVEQLKAIGVNATIKLVDWNTWVSDVYTGRNYQATVVGVDASNMTARAMLERFVSDNGKNFINYNNPDYDDLFRQALAEKDDAARTEIYRQMEANLTEHAANVYIQDLADLVAIRSNLAGYQFYPIYVMDLASVHFVQ